MNFFNYEILMNSFYLLISVSHFSPIMKITFSLTFSVTIVLPLLLTVFVL